MFPNLKQLVCWGDDINLLHKTQPVFPIPNLQRLLVLQNMSTPTFPLLILHRYQSIEEVEFKCCSYLNIFSPEDIQQHSVAYAGIKELVLYELDNLKEIWRQDASRFGPILHDNIRKMEVESCGSLVTLIPTSSSFKNHVIA